MSKARESIVNELTGEVSLPAEFVKDLRAIERGIFRLDNAIAEFKADLKAAKMEREKAIGRPRSMVREAKMEAAAQRKRGRVQTSAQPKES